MIIPQQRAIYCYLVLTLWIFILVAGMYKYIGKEGNLTTKFPKEESTRNNSPGVVNIPVSIKQDSKTKRIFKYCNHPDSISIGSEGQIEGNFSLVGALVIFRHGDRGPLAHVKNVSMIDCGPASISDHLELQSYTESIINSSHSPGFPQFLGPFHSFPILPPDGGNECGIGQLTGQGIIQLRRIGNLLNKAYYSKLSLNNVGLGPSIAIFSTRYRRTFQSALSLLHALVGNMSLTRVSYPFQEAHSLTFCFSDCACPAAEILRKQAESQSSKVLRNHPAVNQLSKLLASTIFDGPVIPGTYPRTVHDSLLTYACHDAILPCKDNSKSVCIKSDHVTSLFTYVDWEARRIARSLPMKRVSTLHAYGLLRHIVSQLLRLVSVDRPRLPPSPRLILYSGHDRTLQYLAGALGISGSSLDLSLPPYASRFVIELYKDKSPMATSSEARQYLFRLLFNGRDLTDLLQFCRTNLLRNLTDIYETTTTNTKKFANAFLCPLESIVRYLHDDYFSMFNSTNFKDSCSIHF